MAYLLRPPDRLSAPDDSRATERYMLVDANDDDDEPKVGKEVVVLVYNVTS